MKPHIYCPIQVGFCFAFSHWGQACKNTQLILLDRLQGDKFNGNIPMLRLLAGKPRVTERHKILIQMHDSTTAANIGEDGLNAIGFKSCSKKEKRSTKVLMRENKIQKYKARLQSLLQNLSSTCANCKFHKYQTKVHFWMYTVYKPTPKNYLCYFEFLMFSSLKEHLNDRTQRLLWDQWLHFPLISGP